MPEEVPRRAAAGGGRVVQESARDGERANHARRDERRELRLVARRRSAEYRGRDAVDEREISQVKRDRTLLWKRETAVRHGEDRPLRRLQDRPRVERERGGARHAHRVHERAAIVYDDRIGLREHLVSRKGERRAAVHRRRAVTERARRLDGREASVQDRAARVLLLATPHDQLARTLLDDLGGAFTDVGVERDGVACGIDREGVAVESESPVGVTFTVQSPVGCMGLVDRQVVRCREPGVTLEAPHVIPAEHAKSARADDEVRDVAGDGSAAARALVNAMRFYNAVVGLRVVAEIAATAGTVDQDIARRNETSAVQPND